MIMALDEATKKFLEDVRKGKPRKFAMICKGVKILNLIVYKKGTEESYKKQIKKLDGSGQFFGGVITGRGKDIVFELLREHYDAPPGKDLLLKQFLDEEAGLSFKPTYAIVDSLTAVSAVDEADSDTPDSVADLADNSAEAMEPLEPPASSTAAPSRTELDAALGRLKPLIARAVAAAPDRKAEIVQQAATIKGLLDRGSLDQGKQELLRYGHLLKELTGNLAPPAGTGEATTADPAPTNQAAKDDKIAAQLHAALDALRPSVDLAIQSNPDAEDDLLDKLSQIVDLIRGKQFSEARSEIGALGHVLARLR
jgi:hypothetical protein